MILKLDFLHKKNRSFSKLSVYYTHLRQRSRSGNTLIGRIGLIRAMYRTVELNNADVLTRDICNRCPLKQIEITVLNMQKLYFLTIYVKYKNTKRKT